MAETTNAVNPNRIREDIERTRDRMTGTIDELQDRLAPRRLVDDAKVAVKDAARDTLRQAARVASTSAERAAAQARRTGTAAMRQARHASATALEHGRHYGAAAVDQARRTGTRAMDGAKAHPAATMCAVAGAAFAVTRLLMPRAPRNRMRSSWSHDHAMSLGAAAIAVGTMVGLAMMKRGMLGGTSAVDLSDATLDDTLESSFPASDPPSSIPNPGLADRPVS